MIVIRAQGSETIGFGHIKRSVYLVSLIKNQNFMVFFSFYATVLIWK